MHAVEGRHAALLQEPRHLLVGGDHQVLDQAVRLGLVHRLGADDVPAAVEPEIGLG